MYVYYYVHVPGKPEAWVTRLTTSASVLGGLARAAAGRGGDGEDAEYPLVLGRSKPSATGILIPFEWTIGGVTAPLTGDLSLAPVDHEVTQLSLRASYSTAGKGATMSKHRNVEAVVKRFLDSVSRLPASSV